MTIDQQETNRADVSIYGSLIAAGLFFLSSFSDLCEILGSRNDNVNLCELRGKYKPGNGVEVLDYQCSFFRYYIMPGLSVLCGCSLITGSYFIKKWKASMIKDNYK